MGLSSPSVKRLICSLAAAFPFFFFVSFGLFSMMTELCDSCPCAPRAGHHHGTVRGRFTGSFCGRAAAGGGRRGGGRRAGGRAGAAGGAPEEGSGSRQKAGLSGAEPLRVR